MIKLTAVQFIWYVLLLYVMILVIMCILISFSISEIFHQTGYGIADLKWDRLGKML